MSLAISCFNFLCSLNCSPLSLPPFLFANPLLYFFHLLFKAHISGEQKQAQQKLYSKVLMDEELFEVYSEGIVITQCQEIGLVALMFFSELLLSNISFAISLYVSFTNLFLIAHSLIC